MKKKSLPASQGKRRNSPDVNPSASPRSRERLRRHYLPKRVRILFVGEAPPASGRFFYQADSGLYRAIRATFEAAYPALRSADEDFLVSFRKLGCYLVDLCGTPVDKLDPKSRLRVCKSGEKRLAGKLRRLKPAMVVTLVRSIASNVQRAEAAADWSGLNLELPYPGRWHHLRLKFRRRLIPLLRTTLGRKCSLQSAP